MLATAGNAFQNNNKNHEHQQAGCELSRCNRLTQAKPGPVDSGGEGIDAKELDCPELVQCFHQDQRNAADDRRTGQRQSNAFEHTPWPQAQSAANIKCTYRLLHERRPGKQVHVGVEHHGNQQGSTAQGPDIRKVIVAKLPAEPVAQGAL